MWQILGVKIHFLIDPQIGINARKKNILHGECVSLVKEGENIGRKDLWYLNRITTKEHSRIRVYVIRKRNLK